MNGVIMFWFWGLARYAAIMFVSYLFIFSYFDAPTQAIEQLVWMLEDLR